MANRDSKSAAHVSTGGGLTADLRAFTGRALDWMEPGVELLIRLCGWSSILFVLAIFAFVFREGFPALGNIDLVQFFTNAKWRPTSNTPSFGILGLICGTGLISVLSMLIAVPFGLGAAVFVSEFCTGKVKETLKVVIELLAAIPSVVWGFVGVVCIGPMIMEFGDATGLYKAYVGVNVMNASLVLALMSIPVIVSVGEDSLKAVPDSFREAAISLGATRWEVVYRVLFPAAKNGLLAAVLLGVGRAIGETMAVLMCSGHAVGMPQGIFRSAGTLTATIAAEMGEAESGGTHYQVLFLIGVVLFGITFLVNLTADIVVKGIKGSQK